jgi:hypothetical protein
MFTEKDINIRRDAAPRPRQNPVDEFSKRMFKALGSEFAVAEFRDVLDHAVSNESLLSRAAYGWSGAGEALGKEIAPSFELLKRTIPVNDNLRKLTRNLAEKFSKCIAEMSLGNKFGWEDTSVLEAFREMCGEFNQKVDHMCWKAFNSQRQIPKFENDDSIVKFVKEIWFIKPDQVRRIPAEICKRILYLNMLEVSKISTAISEKLEGGEITSDQFDEELAGAIRENSLISLEFEEALIRNVIVSEGEGVPPGGLEKMHQLRGGRMSKVWAVRDSSGREFCLKPISFETDYSLVKGSLSRLEECGRVEILDEKFSHTIGRNIASANISEFLFPGRGLVVGARPVCQRENGGVEISLLMDKASGAPLWRAGRAILNDGHFIRDLTDLQILDMITGQLDRHMGNFHFDASKMGPNQSCLQAFDNDQCLGDGDIWVAAQDLANMWRTGSSSSGCILSMPPVISQSAAYALGYTPEVAAEISRAREVGDPNAMELPVCESVLRERINGLIARSIGHVSAGEILMMLERFLDASQMVSSGFVQILPDDDMGAWSSAETKARLLYIGPEIRKNDSGQHDWNYDDDTPCEHYQPRGDVVSKIRDDWGMLHEVRKNYDLVPEITYQNKNYTRVAVASKYDMIRAAFDISRKNLVLGKLEDAFEEAAAEDES